MLFTIFATVVPWLIIAAGTWLLFELTRLSGRLLLRLDSLSQQVTTLLERPAPAATAAPAPARATGLLIGRPAPGFELPDLSGARHSLASFRGRSVLTIFFNPQCGHCVRMTESLAKLNPEGGEERPRLLIISTGTPDVNRELVENAGLKCPVLLQSETEVASQYLTNGTPMGYLISADGIVASPLIVGADALLAVASGQAPATPAVPVPQPDLPLGSEAPGFELTDLAGDRHSLSDYKGRRLVIFFSPQCGFCTRMADDLAKLPLSEGHVLPLLISAGSRSDNQSMVDEYGLRCPLLLQGESDVSSRYGCSGTPMGYLIDEQGRIAGPRIAGAAALLAVCRTVVANTAAANPVADAPAVLASTLEAPINNSEPPAGETAEHEHADGNDHQDGHQPCGKCKKGKKSCTRCSISKSSLTQLAASAEVAPVPFDIVDLRQLDGIDEVTNEILNRSEASQRLIVIHGNGDGPLSSVEAAALRRFLRQRTEWVVAYQPETADRFLVLSRDLNDRKALPSIFTKAANFAKALSLHVADGGAKISSEQMERRLEICALCDRRSGDHCSACGCDLPTKAGWRTSSCPVGKWPALNKQPVA